MTPQQIATKLVTRKGGQIFSVVSRRKCKTKKDCPFIIEKVSHRQGILAEYANRAPVRQAVENKERTPPELPKGAKRAYHIGKVKFYEMNSGKICMAVPVTGNKQTSEYLVNGKPVDMAAIEEYLLASEKQEREVADGQAEFVMIGTDNIVEVK